MGHLMSGTTLKIILCSLTLISPVTYANAHNKSEHDIETLFFWLFIALLVVGNFWLIAWHLNIAKRFKPGSARESAKELLEKRYARGEIELQEYREKMAELSASQPDKPA